MGWCLTRMEILYSDVCYDKSCITTMGQLRADSQQWVSYALTLSNYGSTTFILVSAQL